MKTQMDDIMQDAVAFDPAQLHAIKTVERAMKVAAKLGVSFWDDNGIMMAYNTTAVERPKLGNYKEYQWGMDNSYPCFKALRIPNFHAGNKDECLSFNTITI